MKPSRRCKTLSPAQELRMGGHTGLAALRYLGQGVELVLKLEFQNSRTGSTWCLGVFKRQGCEASDSRLVQLHKSLCLWAQQHWARIPLMNSISFPRHCDTTWRAFKTLRSTILKRYSKRLILQQITNDQRVSTAIDSSKETIEQRAALTGKVVAVGESPAKAKTIETFGWKQSFASRFALISFPVLADSKTLVTWRGGRRTLQAMADFEEHVIVSIDITGRKKNAFLLSLRWKLSIAKTEHGSCKLRNSRQEVNPEDKPGVCGREQIRCSGGGDQELYWNVDAEIYPAGKLEDGPAQAIESIQKRDMARTLSSEVLVQLETDRHQESSIGPGECFGAECVAAIVYRDKDALAGNNEDEESPVLPSH
ncbi:hypothetical protein SELMODRAFT_425299 [Selaginella moellendorffii]|uniref:Uncharacterized protein n=1 Tax=Selaginella moellendorffii TaxID=88036 RepID=D8SSN3_SELML|nr:hypothetical protein SELMODRAFT_425299 [Selaginella moellendorffii]